MSDRPTVYVVDDDELARESVCALCESMGVASEAFASAEEFLASYDESPGCLVTDLRMLGMSGLQLQERLDELGIQLPVVIITAHATTSTTVRALQKGALTLIEKPCNEQELWEAISAGFVRDRENRERRAARRQFEVRLAQLTPEEREVLDMIVAGMPNKQIAAEQEVSERTIETRRQRVFRKMGADSLAHLVRLVVEAESEGGAVS